MRTQRIREDEGGKRYLPMHDPTFCKGEYGKFFEENWNKKKVTIGCYCQYGATYHFVTFWKGGKDWKKLHRLLEKRLKALIKEEVGK